MDDDKKEDAGSPPQGGSRKRAPPTIDLTAASVSDSATASNESNAEASGSVPQDSNTPRASWRDRLDAARSSVRWPSFAWPGSSSRASPVVAGAVAGILAGTLVAGIALGGMWLASGSGGFSSRIVSRLPQSTSKADMEALGSRVAKIESRAGGSVVAASPADPALMTRIDTLEKSIASLREDIAAARGQSDKAAAALNELKAAPAPAAPDLGAIEQRIGKIERATIALTGEIAAPQKAAEDDLRVRRVTAANLLDAAVRQGEPYSVALAAAKPLAENAAGLKPLDEFAASGLPSVNVLSRELLMLLPKLAAKPDSPAAPSGVLDRLSQSASKLVRIQRTDATPSAAAAVVARATGAAQANDIATARRELTTLSASDRAPVQAWMDKVDARDAALAASKQFASDTMTALSKPAQ